MAQQSKGKPNIKLAWLVAALPLILTFFTKASVQHYVPAATHTDSPPPRPQSRLLFRSARDTPPPPNTQVPDTAITDTTVVNTIDSFNLKMSKDTLAGPVKYHAEDSLVIDVPGKKMFLYGKSSSINYANNELTAPEIQYDQSTNLVRAYLKKDSTGKVISYVGYTQADFQSMMDSITLNMKTLKGITKGTYTKQGEMYVYGERIKKVNDEVFYAYKARFTTCNLDTPHFAFVSKKIKFVNQKMGYSGPVHPEFEGVPVPIILPFGVYPLKQGRHSGILSPSFAVNNEYGISLENMGYYKVLSDNFDVIGRGSVYSYGGWRTTLNPRYVKRYRYQGGVVLQANSLKRLDEPASKAYNFTWDHTMDAKARPGVQFSANVNAGTTKFNSLVPNSAVQNFQNQLGSSIRYQKVWQDKPYQLQVTGRHDQNGLSKLTNIFVPDVNFNVSTQYPFRKKERVGELRWFENLGLGLNTTAASKTSFYDTLNAFPQLLNNFEYGANHSIPISLQLPALGPIIINPTVSYQESWYYKKSLLSWNNSDNKIDTLTTKGFYTARSMNYGISASTRIFGLFTFKPTSRVKAIRHEIRPSLSATYQPNFAKNNIRMVQVDSFGRQQVYNIYQQNTIGQIINSGQSAFLNFGLDNNVSMKVKDKNDTSETALKKVSLLDGLSFATGYNFLADSFRLSLFSVRAFTNLFQKVNITADATIDPYRVNQFGRRIDKITILDKPYKLGYLTSAQMSLSSRFAGGDAQSNVSAPPAKRYNNSVSQRSGIAMDEFEQEAIYAQQNPDEFADFSIPWNVDFTYTLGLTRNRIDSSIRFQNRFTQYLTLNGGLNLTDKWKIQATASYSFRDGDVGLLTVNLSRDLHCWQMSVNVTPVGRYKYFSINISPKSPILRDLKVNRTRSFTNF